MALSSLLLLLFLLLPALLFLFSKRKPKLNLPPGPRPSPIFGNLLQVGDIPHRTIYELSKTYGPIIYTRMGQIPFVSVTSPALAQEVLRKLDLVCCTRPHMTVLQEYTFNYCDVSAAPYGDNWRNLRKDILVAGTDAPAATLTWAMTQLARHPRVMKKAQEELRRVVGDKGKVEESDLPHCEYLKLVMNETLRLHPQDLFPRVTMEDCNIGGYDVPKGTRVVINTWAIARDEAVWENATEFLPERFEGSSINFWGNDFQYLPFGAGRRMCPGINFGMQIVSLALANLLYTFDWEFPVGVKEGDIDLDDAPGFGTYSKTPLLLVPKKWY